MKSGASLAKSFWAERAPDAVFHRQISTCAAYLLIRCLSVDSQLSRNRMPLC